MEILSSAGSMEALVAAVRAGADAVYLGLENFNARRNAENFNSDSIKDAIRFCHARNVSVYLTLNILIYNEELEEAVETAIVAAKAGIDGIICADLGLAKILKETIPNVPLHASTQMTIHTPDALPILKELGFKRVVPSREMSKEELRKFTAKAKELGIEVEIFVHGALCMCMSGQCLMSANLGGRSGNRGLCAGTCRLPFKVQGGNDYALSLKDLSLIEYIDFFKEIGIDSLKIEGRMKGAEYVAATTAACRNMMDNGFVPEEIKGILSGVFSRSGFTDGYYQGKIEKDMFGVRTDENITLSKETKNKTHEFYRRERQTVPLKVQFICKAQKEMQLTLKEKDIEVTVLGYVPQVAKTRGIDEEFVVSKLEKFGGTQYFAENISVDLDENLFCSASMLGELRRNALEKLQKAKGNSIIPKINPYSKKYSTKEKGERKIIAKFQDIKNIPDSLKGIDAVIVNGEDADKININLPIIADIPAGMSDKKFIEKAFSGENISAVICKNLAAINIAREKGIPFVLGSELNLLNHQSGIVAKSLGASAAVLSTEIKLQDIASFGETLPIGLTLYGNTNLMCTRNCPIKSGEGCKTCSHIITDRKNVSFPVFCRGGYSYIKNSRPIWLADRMNEFENLDFAILEFTNETEEEIEKIITQYVNGINITPPESYTRGLYYKGVL